MRFPRPFLSIVTILLLFSNISFSQSSIYKDAMELAAHLEENRIIYVELIKANNSQSRLIVKRDETELKSSNPNKFAITDYEYYSIELKDSSALDTIIISINDTLLLSKISAAESFPIYIDNYPDNIYGHNSSKEFFDFDVEDEINAAQKLLFTLSAHSNFINLENSPEINFQKLQAIYSSNPFLNNPNIRSPLLQPNVDDYFDSDTFDSFNLNFSKAYFTSYPWHKLMYGDSLLDFQKTVSFKDASTNYRKQITTSQNELTDASIRINQTSKSKGFLDAKTVAVGLSDFIAERAQEELNLTFFNRFKKNLENPSELTVLFPNTKNLLYQFEISNYKTLLSHARESFKVDLDNLGLNFPEVLKLKKYKNLYNSPEVFNLSLIYSIADLAYKEEPVENILVAAYQKLQERKKEINKSINAELADNFIASVKPKGTGTAQVTSVLIQKNGELQTLKTYISEYLIALKEAKESLLKDDELLGIMLYLSYEKFLESEGLHVLHEFVDNYNDKFESIDYNFIRPLQYNNRRINESSLLSFYQKTIEANLNGKQYYGYLLDNPHPEDYELFFKPQPDSINSIIAKGIENSRNLMYEDLDKTLVQVFQSLQYLTFNYQEKIKEHILWVENYFGPQKKILHFKNQINLLKSAIQQEAIFWENLTDQNYTDHHIAGFYYLIALMEQNAQIQLFTDVANSIEAGEDYDDLVKKDHKKSLEGDSYQKNMQLASDQLDSILVDFQDNVKTLSQEYGNQILDDSTFQHQQLIAQFQQDTISLDKEMNDSLFILNRRIKLIRHAIKKDIRGISRPSIKKDLDYDVDPVIAPVITAIENLKSTIDGISYILREYNGYLKVTNDNEEELKVFRGKIDSLKSERIVLEEELKMLWETNFQKIEVARKAKINEFSPKKSAILEKYKLQLDLLKNSTSKSQPKPLREIYSLQNNIFLKDYLEKKNSMDNIKYFEHEEMQEVNNLNEQLDSTKQVFKNLKAKRTQLENYFTQLDTTYCRNLVAAQENANNLAKSLEVSAHLLFAFRDYERNYDTVFVYDSSYLKVTDNIFESLTQVTKSTVTRDSLVITRKPLDGTSDKLIAASWITRKEFDALRKNKLQWNLFLALLYQRLHSIEDAPNFSAEGVALLATKFLSITHDMETYRSELRRKKATHPESINFKDYYPFIRSTVDLFNTVITTSCLRDTSATLARKLGLQNIPRISNEALSLYENIYVQDYGNAILNAMELLKIISTQKLSRKESQKSQRSINAVLTYGTFMANMINAQSSDQVKNILKSATLPPGSSRIKRETVSSFTINSYLGAAIGRDRLLNIPDNLDLKQDAFGASLSVPIGFTYSFSPNIIKNNSSFSIHVPLLDLGAITAYRQNPDNPNYSIDDLPDFSWQNLFSPGAFVVYNFANSPFSLGVGGQYGPQLREITIDTGEAVSVNSWRFPMAFFTIDVPFFNLHTGARKIIVN